MIKLADIAKELCKKAKEKERMCSEQQRGPRKDNEIEELPEAAKERIAEELIVVEKQKTALVSNDFWDPYSRFVPSPFTPTLNYTYRLHEEFKDITDNLNRILSEMAQKATFVIKEEKYTKGFEKWQPEHYTFKQLPPKFDYRKVEKEQELTREQYTKELFKRVKPKTLEKMKKLKRLAEKGTVHESKLAEQKVDELARRYKVDLSLLEAW